MALDSRYKGNRITKDAGQKPQNAENKEYVEMIQEKTTFEAGAEGGSFRYSENFQNFDPEKEDYPDLEYSYPPFNPPPFDPWPGPVPPKDPSDKDDITAFFECKDPSFCWCPDEEKCGAASCTEKAVAARVVDDNGELVYCHNNKLCITGRSTSPKVMKVEITMEKRTKISGDREVRQQARDIVAVSKCADDKCCDCKRSKIQYTTNAMNINETQNLSATNISDACKTKAKVTWTVSNGSLDKAAGRDVVFTAPATNLNCDESADITLYCDGKVIDTLHITINATGTGLAVIYNTCYQEVGGDCTDPTQQATVRQRGYGCDGSLTNDIYCACRPCTATPPACAGDPCLGHEACSGPGFFVFDQCASRGITSNTCADIAANLTMTRPACGGDYDGYYWCYGTPFTLLNPSHPLGAGTIGVYTDARTTAMKNAGCCPPQLS